MVTTRAPEMTLSQPWDMTKTAYAIAPVTVGMIAFTNFGIGSGQGVIGGAIGGAISAGTTAAIVEYTVNNGMVQTHSCEEKSRVIMGSAAMGALMGAGSSLVL